MGLSGSYTSQTKKKKIQNNENDLPTRQTNVQRKKGEAKERPNERNKPKKSGKNKTKVMSGRKKERSKKHGKQDIIRMFTLGFYSALGKHRRHQGICLVADH